MSEQIQIPRVVVAGVASGVGKTTVVLGLAIALRRRGLNVATFKCGPDYLDPTYHERASQRTCHNLDAWMMGREALLSTFQRGAAGADIALIEGVMGLYDGLAPDSNAGSTAEVAAWLDTPVILTVDASGMARTFAALVEGMGAFDPALQLQGAIANFVGSRGHLQILGNALTKLPLLGGLPKSPEQAFAERHLGLHAALEGMLSEDRLDFWGTLCEEWLDIDRILAISRMASGIANPASRIATALPKATKPRCRIGIARDAAFHFYYEENLRLLEQAGAELVAFSPLLDQALPDVQGLYIGGGYPELHAPALAANHKLKSAIANFATLGKPIYAECGGLMYLSNEIVTIEGKAFPMVGLVPGRARMRERLQALGYVEVTTECDTLLGPAGIRFRGHQFRYSDFEFQAPAACELGYRVRKRRGKDIFSEGYCGRNWLASYVHGHWASHPQVAEEFVRACARCL